MKRLLAFILGACAIAAFDAGRCSEAASADVAEPDADEVAAVRREANQLRAENAALEKRARNLNATADRVEGKETTTPTRADTTVLTRFAEEPLTLVKNEPVKGKAGLYKEWLAGLSPGKKYLFRAEIKAENVSGHPQKNIKFGLMLHTEGKTLWPAAKVGDGSFDWREVSFETILPFGMKNCLLLIGLEGEQTTGAVSVRNLKAELLD